MTDKPKRLAGKANKPSPCRRKAGKVRQRQVSSSAVKTAYGRFVS